MIAHQISATGFGQEKFEPESEGQFIHTFTFSFRPQFDVWFGNLIAGSRAVGSYDQWQIRLISLICIV